MRTLKKTLSLLLAVALVLSLTVVGASAAYTGNKVDTLKDADEVGEAYSEAVGVMVGLGIIEGYEDATLRPTTNYTREQAAKIIAYMQLGPEKADSLRCTTAPFSDVNADRWSAGYIAYCVEKGIIDGMGDGTFQPEAKLTGYQWAKMLLCAVGYGANDEYVGNSWSLNTAKDALDKGIFDGDLEGADHTPLQRQQAVLYAFNALTNEKASVVVYSPSLGDYILRYGDFADRATYEGTLGWNVYKLASSTGIIVDNEAMGNATTVLSSKYTAGTATDADAYVQCAVAANTGLDMMYHAAKIWHVNGKTAVYVMDLATAEVANCPADKKTDYSIGENTKGDKVELYEIATVDNTALDKSYGKVTVGYTYALDELGTRSETKKTTVIGNEGAVDNDDIKTDISKINRGDAIIYIKAESTTSDGEGYHVSAVSYTKATIKDYSKVKKTVTLDNGDVLSASKFFNGDWSDVGFGTTVTITLDTHGHFIDFDAKSAKVIGYFTGTIRNSTAHDVWYSDAAFAAQFVNITTGDTEEVPVSAEWVSTHGSYVTGEYKGYYDITDTIYGSDNYYPTVVSESNNIYASSYVFDDGIRFDATTYKIGGVHNVTGDVYFDNDTVTFIIANNRGSKLSIEKYTGTEEMLAAYSENYPVAAITLRNLAVTGHFDDQGTFYADVIFAFDGAESVSSGTLFYPENVTADVYPGGLYRFEGGYMNGTEFLSDSVIRNTNATITRGFYTFTVNSAGVWTLTESNAYEYTRVTVRPVSDTKMYITSNNTGVEREVLADAKIVDLRSGAGTDVDSIKELSDLYYKNNNEYHNAKVIIKAEAMGQDARRLMSASGRIEPDKLLETYNEDRLSQLPETFGAALEEAKSTLARTANPQLADFILDRAYFAELRAAALDLGCPFLDGYADILTDSTNLKSAVRTVRMGKGFDFMEEVLIPGGTVDVGRIVAAGDKESITALYANSLLDRAAALGAEAMEGGSMTDFEKACDNAVTAYLKRAKLVSYGPEAAIAYLAAVENEITAVRMILTGRLAGVSSESIRERLRDMYA